MFAVERPNVRVQDSKLVSEVSAGAAISPCVALQVLQISGVLNFRAFCQWRHLCFLYHGPGGSQWVCAADQCVHGTAAGWRCCAHSLSLCCPSPQQ